jgi:uncharacterized Zn finger protein (UPF0148 family)
MKCPRCGFPEMNEGQAECPRCGSRAGAEAGVVRTSAVRVAAGDTDRVYRSVDELPPEMRRKLQKALHGPNADTFVIADERGREQLYQVISGLPSYLQKKVMAAFRVGEEPAPSPRLSRRARCGLGFAALALLFTFLWLVWRT